MLISIRELSLAGLDAVAADALALFIDQRERPLQGLAGLCDWRLCGQLSRVLATGFFQGQGGEALLMPVGHRFRIGRLLAFGLGEAGRASQAQLQRAFEAAVRAGARSLVLSIDALGDGPEEAAAAWVSASRGIQLERQILMGDVRSLGRSLRAAGGADPFFQIEGQAIEVAGGQRRA